MQEVIGDNAAADWWKHAVVYQIYPRSFADSNGDGIGDLQGVIDRLDYLQDLGVDALWFSPFYPSPQHDHGYDVSDYFDINPEYGTLPQFTQLIDGAHLRGMRVLIDVVPNHSSSEHEWFKKALESEPGSLERDLYMFRFGGDEPPNNWESLFGGEAWSPVYPLTGREADRGWWYLHLFDSHQPDFNWDNPHVHDLFEEYLRFWCDLGVDGFRVDVAHGLIKAAGLPTARVLRGTPEYQAQLETSPYFDQDDVQGIYRRWREILDEYGPDRMLVGEVGVFDLERRARYVSTGRLSQVFNFDALFCGWNSARLTAVVGGAAAATEQGIAATWVLSNHDVVRHPTRFGFPVGARWIDGLGPADPRPDLQIGMRRALAMTTFLLGLPGSMYLYNGEELGLPEVLDLPDAARTDPTWQRSGNTLYGRDGCRVPLPWSEDPESDFGGKPWLPMPEGWGRYAASVQRGDSASTLEHYRRALALRRQLRLGVGDFDADGAFEESGLVWTRVGDTLVVINLGLVAREVPATGDVLLESAEGACKDGLLDPNTAAWIEIR